MISRNKADSNGDDEPPDSERAEIFRDFADFYGLFGLHEQKGNSFYHLGCENLDNPISACVFYRMAAKSLTQALNGNSNPILQKKIKLSKDISARCKRAYVDAVLKKRRGNYEEIPIEDEDSVAEGCWH